MSAIPALPPNAPRTNNPVGRWLGRSVLRLFGWRIEGEFPDLPRLVMVVAPHSSGWDAVWGLAAKLALGLDIVFIGKKELFWWPLGFLLRRFGGRPVDRGAPGGIVDQVAQQMRGNERYWFVLAPEGTRRRVERWKSGFWKIARRADVPVFCAWFDYPSRTVGFGPLLHLSDDFEADHARLREIYRPYQGKNRGTT